MMGDHGPAKPWLTVQYRSSLSLTFHSCLETSTSMVFNGQKQWNNHLFNVSWFKIMQLKEAFFNLTFGLPKKLPYAPHLSHRCQLLKIAEFQKQSCLETSSAFDHHICTFVMDHHQRLEIVQDPPQPPVKEVECQGLKGLKLWILYLYRKKCPPCLAQKKMGEPVLIPYQFMYVYSVLLYQNELKPTGVPACHIHSTYRISYNQKHVVFAKLVSHSFTPITFCAIVCLVVTPVFLSFVAISKPTSRPTNQLPRAIHRFVSTTKPLVSSRPTEGTHRFFGTSTNQRLFDLRESKTVKLLGDENLPIIEHHHEKSTICRCISYLHIPP